MMRICANMAEPPNSVGLKFFLKLLGQTSIVSLLLPSELVADVLNLTSVFRAV